MSLWLLFFSAFISSTLFPGGSEAVLAYLASDTNHPFLLLIAVSNFWEYLGWYVQLAIWATKFDSLLH